MKKLALGILLFLCTGFSFGESGLKTPATLTSILIRVPANTTFYCNPLNISTKNTIEVTTEFFDKDGSLVIQQEIDLEPGQGANIIWKPAENQDLYCKTTFNGRKSKIRVGAGLGSPDEVLWMVNVH